MTWALAAELLGKWGPKAYDLIALLISKWSSPAPMTLADVDELRALGAITPRQAMIDALNRAGVALDSPQAVALLALVP